MTVGIFQFTISGNPRLRLDRRFSQAQSHILIFTLCILIVPLELQTQDIWQGLANLKDPRLQQLSQQLFSTVMNSKAPSTEKKYMYAFGRWKRWAEAMDNIPVFPVEAIHLALYLQLAQELL